jgi:hypothetical protein
MEVSVRPKVYSLPSYSLTGDLLGFLRCGLQYRYTRVGKLPPSRPVQLWFGEFIHGVLEESFRRYQHGATGLPPWPTADLDEIRSLVKARLGARGLFAWSPDLERLGDERANAAVQDLGPHLFPIIHRAEVRLTGARPLPAIQSALQFREADRYEMVGVVDVVTHVELADPNHATNPIVGAVTTALGPTIPPQFEVIIDYKGMRRPAVSTKGAAALWTQYEWQIQTYGELRRTQPDALQVAAGVLLYVNELYPTRSDLELLKSELADGSTDVPPPAGSDAERLLRQWRPRDKQLPQLPLDYRLARALRIVPITPGSISQARIAFDNVVKEIETCRGREVHGAPVSQAWTRNSSEENTCVVCDSRTFCPDYLTKYATKHGDTEPRLPGVKTP